MRTKWIYTMFVLALSLFTSCNNEADEAAGNKKTRTIVFRLSVDDAVGSRATWGEDYPQGDAVPFDTRINLGSLQVVVYDANNGYVGKAKNVLYWSVSGNENDNTKEEYEFVGDLSHITDMTEGESYKFMVLANCPDVENGNLGNLTYNISNIAYDNGFIPMWGVRTINLTGDELQDLDVIDLLRAVAKVEVIIGSDVTETVSDVKLTRYNEMGFCLPYGYASVSSTGELNTDGCMNEYRLMKSDGLVFHYDTTNKKYFIYVPEYDNLLPADEYTEIALKVDSKNYNIQFTNYEDGVSTGERFDLVRNHIYRYTITDVKTSGQLVLKYQVADWNKGDEWTLDFAYPTYVNPVMPLENIDDNKANDIAVPWNPTMEYDSTNRESKAFSCWFQITAPTGQQWTPVLQTGNINAEIKVYKDGVLKYDSDDTTTYPATNLVAAEGWYNIKVIPTQALGTAELKYVELGITYTPSFDPNGGARYLLINGEGDNHYWHYNEDDRSLDPRLIRIYQVQTSSSD